MTPFVGLYEVIDILGALAVEHEKATVLAEAVEETLARARAATGPRSGALREEAAEKQTFFRETKGRSDRMVSHLLSMCVSNDASGPGGEFAGNRVFLDAVAGVVGANADAPALNAGTAGGMLAGVEDALDEVQAVDTADEEDEQYSCVLALHNLSCELQVQEILMREGIVPVMLELAVAHSVASGAGGGSGEAKAAVGSSRGRKAKVAAVEEAGAGDESKTQVVEQKQSKARSPKGSPKGSPKKKKGGGKAAVAEPTMSEKMVQSCCATLYNLSCNNENHAIMLHAGVVGGLRGVLGRTNDIELTRFCAAALFSLTDRPEERVEFVKSGGAVRTLIECNRRWTTHLRNTGLLGAHDGINMLFGATLCRLSYEVVSARPLLEAGTGTKREREQRQRKRKKRSRDKDRGVYGMDPNLLSIVCMLGAANVVWKEDLH